MRYTLVLALLFSMVGVMSSWRGCPLVDPRLSRPARFLVLLDPANGVACGDVGDVTVELVPQQRDHDVVVGELASRGVAFEFPPQLLGHGPASRRVYEQLTRDWNVYGDALVAYLEGLVDEHEAVPDGVHVGHCGSPFGNGGAGPP
jgi:hypothetical protein